MIACASGIHDFHGGQPWGKGDVMAEAKTAVTRRRAVGTRDRIMSHLAAAGEISDESGMASTVLAREVGYPGSSIAFAQLLSGMERSGLIRREVRGKRTYRITAVPGGATRLVPAGERKPMSRAAAPAGVDYDELARRLLVQVVHELAGARRQLGWPAGPVQNGAGAPDAGLRAGPGGDPPAQPVLTLDGGLAAKPAGFAAVLPGGQDEPGAASTPGQPGGTAHGPGDPDRTAADDAPGQPDRTLEGTVADLQRELASAREMHSSVSAENARLREQLRAARRSLARLRGRATRRPVTEDLDADETGLLDHLLAPAGKPGDDAAAE
jgi:hypothetical protein